MHHVIESETSAQGDQVTQDALHPRSRVAADQQLLHLCRLFVKKHHDWEEMTKSHGSTVSDEDDRPSPDLDAARESLEADQKLIETLPAQTDEGAFAKLEIAVMLLEWSRVGGSREINFLVVALRELSQCRPGSASKFCDVVVSASATGTNGEIVGGLPSWFTWLPRLLSFSTHQSRVGSDGAPHSQG
jgi:hypothetical protein